MALPESTFFARGQWNAICHRCGGKFKSSELFRTWEGLMVCAKDWEARHPQDFTRAAKVELPLPWTRRPQDPIFVDFTEREAFPVCGVDPGPSGPVVLPTLAPGYTQIYTDVAVFSCIYWFRMVAGELWVFADINPSEDAAITRINPTTGAIIGGPYRLTGVNIIWYDGGYGLLETATDFWVFGVENFAKVPKTNPAAFVTYSSGPTYQGGPFSFPDYSGTKMWVRDVVGGFEIPSATVKYYLWDTATQTFTGAVLSADPAARPASAPAGQYPIVPHFGAVSMSDGSAWLLQTMFNDIGHPAEYGNSWLSHVNAAGVISTTLLPNPGTAAIAHNRFTTMVLVGTSLWLANGTQLIEFDTLTQTVLNTYAVPGPVVTEDDSNDLYSTHAQIKYSSAREALYWVHESIDPLNPYTYGYSEFIMFDLASRTLYPSGRIRADGNDYFDDMYDVQELGDVFYFGAALDVYGFYTVVKGYGGAPLLPTSATTVAGALDVTGSFAHYGWSWYKWTPAVGGTVAISLEPTGGDPYNVYRAIVYQADAMTYITATDVDNNPVGLKTPLMSVVAGTTYYIRIAGIFGTAYYGSFRLRQI